MIRAKDSTNWDQMVADLISRAFNFLLDLGFEVVKREETLVRYESDAVFVNAYHGRSSHQVGLELGRLEVQEIYSLHEVLRFVSPANIAKARLHASAPEELERCLQAIASTIDADCRALLAGDAEAFRGLRRDTSVARQAATQEAQYGAVIDRADRSWEQQDRVRAAELYEAAEPALDQTRRKRLAYIRGKEPR